MYGARSLPLGSRISVTERPHGASHDSRRPSWSSEIDRFPSVCTFGFVHGSMSTGSPTTTAGLNRRFQDPGASPGRDVCTQPHAALCPVACRSALTIPHPWTGLVADPPHRVAVAPDVAGPPFQAVYSVDMGEAYRLGATSDAEGALDLAADPVGMTRCRWVDLLAARPPVRVPTPGGVRGRRDHLAAPVAAHVSSAGATWRWTGPTRRWPGPSWTASRAHDQLGLAPSSHRHWRRLPARQHPAVCGPKPRPEQETIP